MPQESVSAGLPTAAMLPPKTAQAPLRSTRLLDHPQERTGLRLQTGLSRESVHGRP